MERTTKNKLDASSDTRLFLAKYEVKTNKINESLHTRTAYCSCNRTPVDGMWGLMCISFGVSDPQYSGNVLSFQAVVFMWSFPLEKDGSPGDTRRRRRICNKDRANNVKTLRALAFQGSEY